MLLRLGENNEIHTSRFRPRWLVTPRKSLGRVLGRALGKSPLIILRVKGTLISEPRFSAPSEMWFFFFPRDTGKWPFSGDPLPNGHFSVSRGKSRILENRGSLISASLALSEIGVERVFRVLGKLSMDIEAQSVDCYSQPHHWEGCVDCSHSLDSSLRVWWRATQTAALDPQLLSIPSDTCTNILCLKLLSLQKWRVSYVILRKSFLWNLNLVTLYRAMRLWCGYGFESCDANGPRNVQTQTLRNTGPFSFPHFSLSVVRNWSWKCLNEGNFILRFVWQENVAIRVPKLHKGHGRYRGETFEMRNR